MLRSFDHTCHLSILKWKQGESTALSTARIARGRLIPLFDMPPAGDFDHEKQRPLSPTEHIRLFGRRLRDRWGQRVAFVDAIMIDDEMHKEGLTRHPLTELLERARIAKALALPVTSIGRSGEYQQATRRFMENNPGLPICFRAAPSDLDSDTFAADIKVLMGDLSCKPAQIFLVLDFKDQSALSEAAIDSFVALLQERINELPHLHDWLGFAVALSSFPTAIKLKPGEVQAYPRTDLVAYGKLLLHPKDLLRVPMFGDYALDTSPLQKPQRRTPSAHLRYSTPKNYIVSKGHSVKTPHGYKAIYPVADALVARTDFMGRGYSEGDHFIGELATRAASTGNAASWRWAATDHHITMNLRAINSLFCIVEPEIAEPAEAQGLLFADLASPPTVPSVLTNSHAQAEAKDSDE
jgi:hypothetical protein